MGRERGGSRPILAALALGLWVVACDDGPPPGPPVPPPPQWSAAAEREAAALEAHLEAHATGDPGALRVHLAFGAGADLDLYVTGPLEETVYYANTPSKVGGALQEDRRCVHDAPRVETVRFAPPVRAGRYRVGVDYPHACGDGRASAPFAVRIEAPGHSASARGLARYQGFEPIVLELDWQPDPEMEEEAGP